MSDDKKPEDEIAGEVQSVLTLEKDVKEAEAALAGNEQFQRFIKLQKQFDEESARIWKTIESQMILNNIKTIKGDWGSITITERLNWDIDLGALPSKFVKQVPDTKKISDTFRLEGEAPEGCQPMYIKFLTKRLKKPGEINDD